MTDPTVLAAAFGAVVGSVLALTGAGGGVLAVPLLVFGLHLSVMHAAPVALIAVGSSAALGAVIGWRQGILRWRAAGLIGAIGCITAPLGVQLAQRVAAGPLMLAFALVLAWTAWRMSGLRSGPLADDAVRKPCVVDPRKGRLRWNAPCAWALGATGGLSGLLTGLLGVGGGFVIVPSLTRFTDLDVQSIVTTSLGVIALVSASGVIAASRHGGLPIDVALPFAAGCVAALFAARRLAPRLPAIAVRRTFALLCVVAAVQLGVRAVGAW